MIYLFIFSVVFLVWWWVMLNRSMQTEVAKLSQKEHISKLSWVLPFGKHKGTQLETVLYEDPRYLAWIRDNVDWLKFSPKIVALIREVEEEADFAYEEMLYETGWDGHEDD